MIRGWSTCEGRKVQGAWLIQLGEEKALGGPHSGLLVQLINMRKTIFFTWSDSNRKTGDGFKLKKR